MHSQLDLPKLPLPERLEKNVRSKVDFLFRHRMRLVESRVRAGGGEGSSSEGGGYCCGGGRVEGSRGRVGLRGQDLNGLSRASGGRELLSEVGVGGGRESDGSAVGHAGESIAGFVGRARIGM